MLSTLESQLWDFQVDHSTGMGVCNSLRGGSRPYLHCFWLPHETSWERANLFLEGKKFFPQNVLLIVFFLSQKDEEAEEEKPLTLTNGITRAEPAAAENGKAQNGHIILSPPVSFHFSLISFHSFESPFSWHWKKRLVKTYRTWTWL